MKKKIIKVLADWEKEGLPTRSGYENFVADVHRWKAASGTDGLWSRPPLMLCATLDDAWGHGLSLISQIAEALGCRVSHLGLCLEPADIISACQTCRPDFLGLTVLQFDTEEKLIEIHDHLPRKTRLIAGGPLFAADQNLAQRAGIHFVAASAADFIRYMIDFDYQPDES